MATIPISENPRGASLVIVETVFIFLDILAVAGRLWARHIQHKSLEFNDWSVIAALIFMIARFGNEISMVTATGFGLHAADIKAKYGLDMSIEFGMLSFADDMLWLALVTTIKLSALHLYMKIFRQPIFVIVAKVAFVLCLMTGVAFIFVRALICRPVAMNWDLSLATQGGKCGDLHTMYLSLASIDLILDLLVVFLPMPVVWTLRMAFGKKIAISFVFGLGALICCITAVRLKFIDEIDADPQYSQMRFNTFAALEPLLGIISVCMPVLPPVFAKFFHSTAFRSTFKDSKAKASSSTGASELKTFSGRRGTGLASSTSASTRQLFDNDEDEHPLNNAQRNGETENERSFGNHIHVSTQWDLEYSSGAPDGRPSHPGMAL